MVVRMATREEIALSDYNKLCIELDYLFDKKYRNAGRVVKYIYYGFSENESGNECGKYVLINTNNDSWAISSNLSDSINFLQLNDTKANEFKQDIKNLINEEAYLLDVLTKLNSKPKCTYTNKLNFLLK